jgi:hypothetical protein
VQFGCEQVFPQKCRSALHRIGAATILGRRWRRWVGTSVRWNQWSATHNGLVGAYAQQPGAYPQSCCLSSEQWFSPGAVFRAGRQSSRPFQVVNRPGCRRLSPEITVPRSSPGYDPDRNRVSSRSRGARLRFAGKSDSRSKNSTRRFCNAATCAGHHRATIFQPRRWLIRFRLVTARSAMLQRQRWSLHPAPATQPLPSPRHSAKRWPPAAQP